MNQLENQIKKRLFFVFFLLSSSLLFLMGRVGYIKSVHGEEYEKKAIMQQVSQFDKMIPPTRGAILDRNKHNLVFSARVFNVILDPRVLTQYPEEQQINTINGIGTLLQIPKEQLSSYIAKDQQGKLVHDTSYVVLKKKIPRKLADAIQQKKLKGIWLEEDSLRTYPYNNFASHVLGFTGADVGRWGIEKQYNETLTGIPGRAFVTVEQGNHVATQQIAPKDGYTIVSTIDETIQHYIEDAIKHAVAEHNPKHASVIVMEPNTGQILGMVSYPSFDPNKPSEILDEKLRSTWTQISDEQKGKELNSIWKNYNISNTYEPGSTFKPMVIAAALEENVVPVEQVYNCTGYKVVADRTIHCWKRTGHGEQTLEQALANSCNVVMMDVVEKLGKEKFYAYQKSFGIGEKTGIDLPGEESASSLLFTPDRLGVTELATSSFGQSFNVTPIQILNAFNAVINGGNLMKPYLAAQILDANGVVVKENYPVVQKKVISRDTSNLLRQYLETVVKDGTGKKARIVGYHIGGKTGTAQQGKRENELYAVSFIAFAPVEDPKVAILALIDQPEKYVEGSASAAPLVKEILENVLTYLEVPYDPQDAGENEEKKPVDIVLEDYTNMSLMDTTLDLMQQNLNYKVIGSGSIVTNQIPAAGTKLTPNTEILLYVTKGKIEEIIPIPNIEGKTYEEAIKTLKGAGLVPVTQGDQGVVEAQNPAAGIQIEVGSSVHVRFKK